MEIFSLGTLNSGIDGLRTTAIARLCSGDSVSGVMVRFLYSMKAGSAIKVCTKGIDAVGNGMEPTSAKDICAEDICAKEGQSKFGICGNDCQCAVGAKALA